MSLLNLYTITSSRKYITEQFKLQSELDYDYQYQAKPDSAMPILINTNKKNTLHLGIWDSLLHPFVPMRTVLKHQKLNLQVRQGRCAVLANCFFVENDKQPYLIRILGHRMFCMAGLYETFFEKGVERYKYRILSTDSADVIGHLTDSMPVVLSPEKADYWLQSKSLQEVMSFGDASMDYWFDYFKVSNEVTLPDKNDKDLLKPLGLSREEIKARERQLMALKIKKDRADRGSSKR